MRKTKNQIPVCQVCGREKGKTKLIAPALIREPVVEEIRRDFSDWSAGDFICREDLNRYRSRHIQSLPEAEKGELAALEQEVLDSLTRQEDRDRLRSQNDYRVNLKAELEIRHLHEKIDHLLSRQWERLVEIQQVQVELMSEITRRG